MLQPNSVLPAVEPINEIKGLFLLSLFDAFFNGKKVFYAIGCKKRGLLIFGEVDFHLSKSREVLECLYFLVNVQGEILNRNR